jgi:acyl phosphate:glycerol-3-phosphate acyltransferase
MESGILLGAFTIAYLLGSIPFGLILTKIFLKADIRQIGSGNIGATNVMRSGKKGLAIATLLLDAGKGALAVWFAGYVYNHDASIIAGLFAVVGHIFPVWLRYKGGKGVATTLGVFFAINWAFALVVCGIWIGAFLVCRISSLSAIMAICYSPVAAYLLDNYLTALLCLSLAGLIIFSHRSNIERLLTGSEHKFTHSSPV